MKILILALAATGLFAQTPIRVCASGCDYTQVHAAIGAAAHGDIIEVQAGEVFTEGMGSLAWKSASSKELIIRSSRWAELPPSGVRVTLADEVLMPTIYPIDGTTPIFRIGNNQQTMTADASTDVLTLSGAIASNGDPVACRKDNAPGAAVMPGGVTASQVYYARDVSGATLKLALTPGGAAIDVTSAGSGTRYCAAVKVGHHVKLIGLNLITNPSTASQYNLLEFATGEETAVAGMPHHITVQHCLIRGRELQNGPRNGIYMNANYVQILDNYVSDIKDVNSENHALFVGVTSDQVVIRNNGLNAASMSIFSGGTGSAIADLMPRNFKVIGNRLYKSGYMEFKAGSGAPTGACFPGEWYRRTDVTQTCPDGACYQCPSGGTWGAAGTGLTYRASGNTIKALMELKQAEDWDIEGNWFDTGFEGQSSGNPGTGAFLSQVDALSAWSRLHRIRVRNNRFDKVWRGFGVSTDGGFALKNTNVAFINNLVTDLAYPTLAGLTPLSGPYSFRADGGQAGIIFDHNTVRLASGGTVALGALLAAASEGISTGLKVTNNIYPQGGQGIFPDVAGTDDCNGVTSKLGKFMQIASSPYPWQNNLEEGATIPPPYFSLCTTLRNAISTVPYVSASNSRLTSGSAYSANCASSCQFASTDSKDLGADIDVVDWETSGAYAGTPRWLEDARIHVGSGHAAISWTSHESCTVKLFTDAARTTLHADTSDGGEQADSRAGNLVNGIHRVFVFGTNTPLTASTTYRPLLTCGTRIRPFEFTTRPSGSSRDISIRYSTARTGETAAANDPTFASPTSISSATNHVFNMSANSVKWYRETGGVARVIVQP